MNKRLDIVDFWRGFSIFTIVLMHLVQSYPIGNLLMKASSFGGAGVHVFILCSGFGLYLSYLKKPVGYRDFLRRRFGKVWIPYIVAVLLWSIWLLIAEGVFPLREVLSHVLLYKMFSTELDISVCYPYWFVSTIIQFYFVWPLVVKLYRTGGVFLALGISLSWSTLVGVLGYEDMRPWGSFCLQYLWEFCLGMWIAELIQKGKDLDVQKCKWWWLMTSAVVGMTLTGIMAWNGGFLKLYNDIPSLLAYLSVLLLIYKLGGGFINKFFIWTSGFGYELYLVHSLVFVIVSSLLKDLFPVYVLICVSLLTAYIVGYGYSYFLKKTNLK